MAGGFQTALDVVNRGLQSIRQPRISSLREASRAANEANFCYDKLRDAELRRNLWDFAIKRAILRPVDASTVIWTPPAWAAVTTYPAFSVVSYTPPNLSSAEFGTEPTSYYWVCDAAITGSASNSTPDVDIRWHRYFGPVTCDPFVAQPTNASAPSAPALGTTAGGSMGVQTVFVTITYVTSSGETVPSAESKITVPASNLFTVASPPAQTGATGYNVYASGSTGTETLQTASPIAIGTPWTEPTTGLIFGRGQPILPATQGFFVGEITLQNGTVYTSLINNNQDVPPTSNWLTQGGTTAALAIVYPIGAGPATDYKTMNAYRLPYGFLKPAPEDPRSDVAPYLGVPKWHTDTDWVFEGDYLVSATRDPIMLRFVADVIDVYDMDPMFCEGLGARIGVELAPALIEGDKLGPIILRAERRYKTVMTEARLANAITAGPTAMPPELYITVRW